MKLLDLPSQCVLIAQSDDFMGPALVRVSAALDATVTADTRALGGDTGLARRVVEDAGDVDVLIAHLTLPVPSTPVSDVDDAEWRRVFAHLVDPLPSLFRAALPRMRARGGGKVVVFGSASALRGMKRTSTYGGQDS